MSVRSCRGVLWSVVTLLAVTCGCDCHEPLFDVPEGADGGGLADAFIEPGGGSPRTDDASVVDGGTTDAGVVDAGGQRPTGSDDGRWVMVVSSTAGPALHALDISTGAASYISPIGGGGDRIMFCGTAVADGVFYQIVGRGDPLALHLVSIPLGSPATRSETPLSVDIVSLFAAPSGALFVVTDDADGHRFASLAPDGTVTPLSSDWRFRQNVVACGPVASSDGTRAWVFLADHQRVEVSLRDGAERARQPSDVLSFVRRTARGLIGVHVEEPDSEAPPTIRRQAFDATHTEVVARVPAKNRVLADVFDVDPSRGLLAFGVDGDEASSDRRLLVVDLSTESVVGSVALSWRTLLVRFVPP